MSCKCGKDDARTASGRSTCNTCKHDRVAIAQLTSEEGLLAFGEPIERSCVEALTRLGSFDAAADELRISVQTVRSHLSQLKKRAALRGYSPASDMKSTTPEGFHVKGVSSYYRVKEDGTRELTGQWVKTKTDEAHEMAAMLDAMTHVADAWQGKADLVQAPSATDEELLCVYPMGDPHLGMYAWAAETGTNHTLQRAEQNLVAAVDHLVDLAPAAHTGMILNLGDFFHFDNERGETTAGTRQDVDTRIAKVAAVGIRCMRRCIDRALTKHQRVLVKNVRGNHDSMMALMLSLCLAQFYERDPRVEVDTSPASYLWHRFGKVLIGAAHGNMCKLKDLHGVMTVDRAKDWGETLFRYFYTGHVHHDTVLELPGVTVETFRTLAPRDKWHTDSGYRSGCDMKLDILHRDWGRIQRHIVGIERLVAAQVPDTE